MKLPSDQPNETVPANTANAVDEPVAPTDAIASSDIDRRQNQSERRQRNAAEAGYTGPDRRSATGLERRRGPGRRRTDDRRSAEEGEMTAEQFEFVMAIETYKKLNKRMFPTWTEILELVGQLGYRKVAHRTISLPDVPEPELTQAATKNAA
ncbi:MAG: hypothetical protein JO353_02895 [Phycisphaerae bacterium]|nr:hypothetical protein [Phycisphaerae bacterium]